MITYKTAATATRYAAAWKIGIRYHMFSERTLFAFDLIDSEGHIATRSNFDYSSRAEAIAAAKRRARLGNI